MNEELTNKWSSDALLSAWIILQMPDFDGDGDVLGEADIEQLARYLSTVNKQMAALLAERDALLTALETLIIQLGMHKIGLVDDITPAIERASGAVARAHNTIQGRS